MKLFPLDDTTLLKKIRELAHNEREITLAVLSHLREVERRHLYAAIGYPSLFEYAVKDLKYSNGAAHRRIASMRLLTALPELEVKLERGSLSLCTLSQAQSFFRVEKTESMSEKRQILSELENKSKREVERQLMSRSTQPELHYVEQAKLISSIHTELRLLVRTDFTEQIEELRALLAHSLPNASIKDLLQHCMRSTLARTKPKAPKAKLDGQPLPPVEVKEKSSRSRFVGIEIKRQVWHRDGGKCTFKHGAKECGAKLRLQFDHIKPWSTGGESTAENLRLRCSAHNQTEALNLFGRHKMVKYIPRLL